MYLSVSSELAEFLSAQGIAVLTGILYDFLKSTKPKIISKTASDFFDFFCLLFLVVIYCILWRNLLYGTLRWHTVLGFAITLILYFLTIHKPIFTAYCIIMKKTAHFLGIIFKILLTVRAFWGKITMYLLMVFKKIYSVDSEGKKYEKKGYQN